MSNTITIVENSRNRFTNCDLGDIFVTRAHKYYMLVLGSNDVFSLISLEDGSCMAAEPSIELLLNNWFVKDKHLTPVKGQTLTINIGLT